MNVGIQGTKTFSDYNVFLRAMRVILSGFDQEKDSELIIYTAGPANINSFAMGFINITENSLKSRGIKTKVLKVPANIIKDRMHDMDYFAFFSQPKESVSSLVREAEDKDIEVGIFRY